ncbi:S-layer family protein [Emticicia sp. C21]|uniref:beta strand repeat-containing protein n=1 Tax=Emticicia sp. C21 TaxID=2302915 RepID=UPI000E3450F9|nr:Ig-like domain repeat protein [Emticicia sp. C21]RFS18431.1 hypothetical protein D0T08_04045 [Emticicia sp. C21]
MKLKNKQLKRPFVVERIDSEGVPDEEFLSGLYISYHKLTQKLSAIMKYLYYLKNSLTRSILVLCMLCFANESFAQQLDFLRQAIMGSNTHSSVAYKVATDNAGNVYATGSFYGNITFGAISLTSGSPTYGDVFIVKYNSSGTVLWAKRAGGIFNDGANSIAVKDGYVYICGSFTNTANFNTPSSNATNTITSANSEDMFLAKFDDSGNFQWAKRAGGPESLEEFTGITVTSSKIYVTGDFTGSSTINFNTPSATGTNELQGNGNNRYMCVAQYDLSGNFQWVRGAGGTSGTTHAYDLVATEDGVYVVGSFQGNISFDQSGQHDFLLTTPGGSDGYVVKYETNGDVSWARQVSSTDYAYIKAISINGSSIYITGDYSSSATFGTTTLFTAPESEPYTYIYDVLVARYETNGDPVWAKRAGGILIGHSAAGYDIDANDAGVFISGKFNNTINFNTPYFTGLNEISNISSARGSFVSKFDETGNFQWAKRSGGDASSSIQNNSIAVSGNAIYSAGFFKGTVNFNTPDSPGTNELTAVSSQREFYLARYTDSDAPKINIKGNTNWVINGSTVPDTENNTDFGSQSASSGSIVKTFTLSNTGTTLLNLTGTPKVAISGTNAADFTVTIQPVSPLAATIGTTDFQITFDPLAQGLRTANVSIANDDTDENPYTFAIQGTGSTPASTTTTLTSNNNPASVGGNIQFTATVIPNTTTGTVTFKEGATTLGTATLSSGVAKFNTDLLTVGTHSITAEYGGDGSNIASTSSAVSQVVNALTAPNLSFIRQSVSSSLSYLGAISATAIDADGNVYVTGLFKGDISLGNVGLINAGGGLSYDVFIAKYNSSGALQWAKRAGGTNDDVVTDIAVSGTDIYIVGTFTATANFNTPSATGSNEITSAGSTDIFIARYNSSGDIQWIRRAGGANTDAGEGITILGTDIYITGNIRLTANFNTPSASGSNEIISGSGILDDIFIAKYNASGNFLWARRAGGSGHDQGSGIVASATGIYVTGYFNETANFNTPSASGSNEITSAGNGDIFLAKYSPAGDLQWVKRAGGTGGDFGNAIAFSGTDVYLTGSFRGTANFNTPSVTGSNEVTSAGETDLFLAKYNDSGELQWLRRAGGTESENLSSVGVSGSHVYMTGNFAGTINFNTPSVTGSNEITSAGNEDGFLADYSTTGTYVFNKRIGGTGYTNISGLALTNTTVYIAGGFIDNINFNNPSASGSNQLVATSGTDAFLAKYNFATTSTNIALTSNNNPASVGANIQFTATVTPNTATGTVTFKDGSTTLGTATLSSGIARFNTDLLIVGTHSITAEYSGDLTNAASTSSAVSQVVNALTEPQLNFIRGSISSGAQFNRTAIDASGNVYVAGFFAVSATISGNTVQSAGGNDIYIAKFNSAGVLQWAKRAGGTGDDRVYGLAVSGSDVYLTGNITGTANFNTPSASGSNELVNSGGDGFIVKYNALGDVLWIRRTGGSGRGIAISGTDIYVCGDFAGTANFNNPSASGSNEIVSAGLSDVYLAKYNTSGDIQWVRRGGGTGTEISYGAIVTSGSDIYIAGGFESTANFNTPSNAATNSVISAGSSDIFVAKFNSAGNCQWARRGGGTNQDYAYGIAVLGTDVYVGGVFTGTANFNTPSASGTFEIVDVLNSDAFLAKYNANGAIQWAKRAGGLYVDGAVDIKASDTNIFMAGAFGDTANFNTPSAEGSNEIVSAGQSDGFLAMYDASGNVNGLKRMGGIGMERASGIAVSGNNVSVVGNFSNSINFNNPSITGSNQLVALNNSEGFLARYTINASVTTTTALTSNNNPANPGANVQLTATITPGAATGTITFKEGATVLGTTTISGGTATLTINTLTAGTHVITAEYSGDGVYGSSVSDVLSQVVNCTAPTGTANAIICSGTTASLSASCATGTVSWYNSTSSTRLSTVSPFVTPPLTTATTYNVRCETVGCNSAFVSVNVTVNAAPNTVISYPSPAICKNAGTTDIVRSGTTGGTFSSSPGGLSLNNSTGRITPGTSTAGTYTVTLTIAASGNCPAYTATTAITITAVPSATIGYAGNGFCTTQGVQNVTLTGTAGGTYSAQPSGLTINASTGQITPGSSTPNNYIVYYSIPETGGCAAYQTSANVAIGTPASATIAYTGSPFCTTSSVKSVNRTGTTGGTFSSSPAGLTISSSNGQITPGTSTPNTYAVTYTIAASSGCPAFTTTTSIAVSAAPSATISYAANSFCTNESPKSVSRTGTTGGTYSVLPSGLTINASTGQITPSTSTPNDYTVYYTIPAANGCAEFQTSYNVSIRQVPDATISYTGSPFCSTSEPVTVNLTGTGGGTFTSSPTGLTINSGSGQITPASSLQGNYTITYTIAANGGCAAFTSTANVGISTVPNATITYTGTPFCGATTPIEVSRTGTAGGTFTSSPSGLTINPATGQITPGTSSMGTYTVTYSVSGACPLYTSTTSLSLNALPSAPTNVTTSTNSICGSESVSLSATCSSGTLTWYNQATGGTALGTGTAFSQTPATTTTYYAACKNGACESSRVATTPVVVQQANIGYDTPFSETGDNFPGFLVQNNLFGYKVRITKPIMVSAVSAILSQNINGGARIRFAVYSDVNNVPTNLLASSSGNSSDNAPTLNAGLNSFPLDNPVTLNCGDYWIAYVVKAGVNNGEYFLLNQQLSNPTFYLPLNFANAFPATINAQNVSSNGNNVHNVYLTGVPDCGPDAPTNISVSTTSACSGASIVLSATCSSGVVQWYNSQTGTAAIGTGSGLSVTLTNNTTYYASCKAGGLEGCRLPTSLVSVTPAPTLTAGAVTSPSVCGGTNGKIAFTTALGNGSYSITFTGSGSPKTINVVNGTFELTGLSAGTYSDFAITTSGCISRDATSKSIADPSAPSAPVINAPGPRVVCSPNTLTLTASGCAGTIRWSNGSGGTSLTLSSVGTYAISATCTVNNCVSNASNLVTGLEILAQPSAPTITTPNSKVVCAPNTLTLTASGCAGTVNWSTGATGTSLVLSSVGTYSITATCTVGSCTSPSSIAVTGLQIVTQPSAPIITAPNPKVVCAPNTLTLTASGCGGTVNWSTGATGTSLVLSSVGTYSITATCTVENCISLASSAVTGLQIVAQPSAPTITAPNPKVVCAPNTLILTASDCAGIVNWSTEGTGTNITLSSVGTYSITATCTVGSCTSPISQAVTGLQIVTQPLAPTIIAPTQKVVCAPSTLTLTASGCGGTVNWSMGATGTSLILSSVGTYSVSATCTAGSCTSPASAVVTGLQIMTQPSAPTIVGPNPKVVCSPGTLTLTASGCGGTVNWSNGGSGTSITLSSVGTYSITATCLVGSCTSPSSIAVTGLQILPQPSAPTITAPNPKIVCAPNTLTLTASGCGGIVNWSTGATGTSLVLSSVGTYSISATCTVGSCTSPVSPAVTDLQIVTQPSAPTITAPTPKVVCAPNTLTLTASGCAGTVNWSNGSSGTSLTLSSVGTYSISATCTIGSCTSPASTAVTGLQIFTQPSAPTITAPNSKVVCAPSTLTLTASSCAGTVNWSTGATATSLVLSSVGTYSITATCTVGSCTSPASSSVTGLQIVTQPSAPTITSPTPKVVCAPNTLTLTASGCAGTVNWSNGGSGTSITLSSVGTYSITATCTVGSCTSSSSQAVTGLQIAAPPTVTITGNINLSCNIASVTRTANGSGSSPTYQWSNGLGTDATATISSPGTYTVTVTSDNGCTSTSTTSVTLESSVPSAPTITAPNPKVVCAPNTLTLTASGCAGTVNWSNGGSGTSITLSSVGTYSITATCTVGSCTSPISQAVTGLQIVTQPSAPTIIEPTLKVVCAPNTLTLTASGCAGTVNWSNGASGTSLTLSSVGTYSITTTCTIGSCTSPISQPVTGLQIVTQPSAPTITAPNPKVVCAPNTLTLTASGCAGTVNWSTGASGTSLTLSSVGTYSISATCIVGSCTSNASAAVTGLQIVTQPLAPTITAPNPKVVCVPNTLTLTVSGCAGTVNWSNGSSGTSLTLSSVGTYSIAATCTIGSCTSLASTAVTGLQIIAQPSAPTIIAPTPKVVCAPNTLTLTASGCAGTVNWSTGTTGTSLVLSSVGTYSITATCTVGSCASPASSAITGLQIVTQPSAPTITSPNTKVVCAPNTLTLTASGCAGTVNWSTEATGTSLVLSSVGTYSITATCTIGSCISPASSAVTGLEIVSQPSAPTITTPSPKVVCSPNTLTLTANGCGGTVNWSNGATGISLVLSSVGTYSISATCTVGSCTSAASQTVTGLQIVTQPSAPTITAPNSKVVCAPNTLTLTASGCAGKVTWSNGSSGTSLTLSSVGTYSITATCTVENCTSPASQAVTGLQIVTQPNAPTITAPNSKVVCAPNTLTLTASGCGGTVSWSTGTTGTSLVLSSVGTYSITATCTVGSCTSPASSAITGLQIVTQPLAPTITAPTQKVVCLPGTLTLTASSCAGTVNWSNGGSGTSLTLSSIGTYSISATCTIGSCTSVVSTVVTGLQITSQPIAQATNTGPYNIGQTIQLNASGGTSYNWTGPASFSSSIQNPAIPNAIESNGGIYTVTVSNNACSATATTQVIVSGIDPCIQVVDLQYVKSGDPYQNMFSLKDGMIIQQIPEQVSIIAKPICPTTSIGSVDLTITGPEINWTILQNVEPYAVFDNLGVNVYGRNLIPGTYTMTVTGYTEDNRIGGTVYGPVVTTFTVVGTMAVIHAPTVPNNRLCAGSTVDVTFGTIGVFDSSNRFNIQLSDSTGGFTNPIMIGTTSIAGTITCQLPQNLSSTGRYLIRVASSNQVVASNPTLQYLSVVPATKSLTANVNTGTITEQASILINANNKITSPANVTYNSGKAILLNPGFESREGSVFKAQIQSCNN